MYSDEVDLIALEDAGELTAIRACLEQWNVRVNAFWIGQPRHLVDVLGNGGSRAPHVILLGHGGTDGFYLPILAESLAAAQPFHAVLAPEDVRRHFRLPGRTVLSTACSTGTAAMVEAFLAVGADQYLAPVGDPDGNAALFYALHFCYARFCHGRGVKESHALARRHDVQTGLFTLFPSAGNTAGTD